MASALGERAANWSEEKKTQEKDKKLPAKPPPMHPTTTANAKTTHRVPPPLPKRSEGRERHTTSPTARKPVPNLNDSPVPSGTATPDSDEPKPQPPLSPTFLPLPESRPATPVVSPPSRTGSPAPAPGGAAPPPLPRRAAARGQRPMSAVGADALASSRPSTPASVPVPSPAHAPVAETAVETTEGEAKAKEGAVVADILVADSETAASKTEPISEPVAQSETRDEPTPSLEGAKAGSDGTSVPVVNGDEVGTGEKSTSAEVNGVPLSGLQDPGGKELDGGGGEAGTGGVREAGSGVDGEVKGKEEKDVVSGDQIENLVNGVETESTEKEGEEIAKREDKEEAEDKEVYVGDATWEERTWKELVRLREEMYWARIGGLR
jgi:hypothetical protein